MITSRSKVERQLLKAVKNAAKAEPQTAIAGRCKRVSKFQLNHFLQGRTRLSLPAAIDLASAIGHELTLTQST